MPPLRLESFPTVSRPCSRCCGVMPENFHCVLYFVLYSFEASAACTRLPAGHQIALSRLCGVQVSRHGSYVSQDGTPQNVTQYLRTVRLGWSSLKRVLSYEKTLSYLLTHSRLSLS